MTQDARKLADVVGEWQTRLLQVDRRNNLLYFRPGRTAIEIVDTSPDEISEALIASRRGLSFDYAEPVRRSARDHERDEDGDEHETEVYVTEGDICTEIDPLDLQRRLRTLRRKEREWEDEQGLNVLFLAVGFLEWIDQDGEEARSPLILIPCDLRQASPRDPFYLLRESDDAEANATLMHALSEHGISLAEFGDSAPSEYIRSAAKAVSKREGWRVTDDVYLGTFAYSKMPMVKDLERMRLQGIDHPLVRQLAGETESSVATDSAPSALPEQDLLKGGGLDDLLKIRDQYAVLPADFSQLRAIETARVGAHLVIHGPPGTGKSQTIANIIATLLADRQRILFVSEKTAALDVVKRRLEECGLGVFCLDLHSERGKKSSVYQQLRESVEDPRNVDSRQFPFESLESKRKQLNRVVRALHSLRKPLGRTIFQVHGTFSGLLAELRDIPPVEFPVTNVGELDQESLAAVIEPCERIARRQDEFEAHTTSRWLSLTERQPSIQLSSAIRSSMDTGRQAIRAIRKEVSSCSEWLDLASPISAEEALHLAKLLDHLSSGDGIPDHWLDLAALSRLREMAKLQREQQRLRLDVIERLTGVFGENRPAVDYRALSSAVRLSQADQTALKEFLGSTWMVAVVSPTGQPLRNAEAVVRSVDDLLSRFPALTDNRCQTLFETWQDLRLAMENAARIAQLAPVPIEWTEARGLAQARRELKSACGDLATLEEAENALHERFSDRVVEVVDDEMLIRYRADYQSFWKRLGRGFRRDQRLLRGHLKVPGKLSVTAAIEGIELALKVRHLRAQWADRMEARARVFGGRFNGRQTDWQAIERDILEAKRLHDTWTAEREILATLLTDGETPGRLRRAAEAAEASQSQCTRALGALGREELMRDEQSVRIVLEQANHAIGPLAVLKGVTHELRGYCQRPIEDLQELTNLLDDAVRLGEIEKEALDLEPSLSADFGDRFDGFATEWDTVDRALTWTEELLRLLPAELSPAVRADATCPRPLAEYQTAADSVRSAVEAFSQEMATIRDRFDPSLTSWGSWLSAPFDELDEWADDLAAHAETAPDWIAYQIAVRDLSDKLGIDVVSQIRSVTDRAELLPKIVQRRILGAWLDSEYEKEPALRHFASKDHDEVRSEFRKLDRALPEAARNQVRERCFSKYPSWETTGVRAGQLGTLRGELSKRRRQLSVRKLFTRIPQLLQALKPAFLMSPLAVSKYLSKDELAGQTIDFDAVIFDEASQVFPEDAVPAIARAKQVVVVGDQHQLPPTNFFRRSFRDDDYDDADDDDYDETTDAFEGRESILDAMIGMVGRNVAEEYLGMHYRSRHDSLIRYSNHYFYDDRLLVFPAPEPAASAFGIRDIYLPDARYEPHAARNRGEAERTVDEVFNLMLTVPDEESIGVVALNRKQADCVRDLIDRRRLDEPVLDERFAEDRIEPFFVKNLENVQGDERDHVILSIGYGPTVGSGRVPNRFGPINREGGERRLNVSVTRARKSMTVVHSLRPTDIRSEQEGPRLLRRYLEYAADPIRAFESEVTLDSAAETESPFEQAVLQALVNRGYRVDRQVGVFGYRIDLAVLSEDGSAYDLGIECDGARYHNTPAARDRDWLRQSVLEGLGWTIHRVWSTAWIRNPEGELTAIEKAIAAARSRAAVQGTSSASIDGPTEPSSPTSSADETATVGPTQEQLAPPEAAQFAAEEPPLLFDEYARAYLSGLPVGPELQYEVYHTLESLIVRVVKREMPVHVDLVVERIRNRYGLGRAGRVIRERIERAVRESVRRGEVSWEPDTHGGPAPEWGTFLVAGDAEADVRPRRPAEGQPPRRIEHISDRELEAGVLRVARAIFGGERETLIVETARQFGYQRTGGNVSRRLDRAISSLISSGRLMESAGMLSVARP